MANQLRFFMSRDDEVAFLRYLERHVFKIYPRRVPVDWKEFRACAASYELLPAEDVYLAATDIGPVTVDRVKRGPDRGSWRVLEVGSPVIFWERSRLNEEGELISGQLWAELDVTPQTGRRDAASDHFRTLWGQVESWMKKAFRHGNPKEFWIGPHAARNKKESGLVLRDNQHRGGTVEVWR